VYIYSADLRIHVLDDAGSTFRKAWGNCSGLGLRKGVKSLFSSAPLSAKLFSSHQKNHRFCHGSGFWNHSPVPFTEETSQKPSGNMMFSKKTWEFEFNQPPTGTDLLGKPNHKPAALEVHYWVSGCMRQCLSSPLAPGHDWVMWWLMAIVGLPQSVKTMLDPLRSPQVTTRANKH
jgi:hypothetical protein